MDDPIRTIIIPVLLLAAIVAIGLYLNREAFYDYGDKKEDPDCPEKQGVSTKPGYGKCSGPNSLPVQKKPDDPFLQLLGARRGYEYGGSSSSNTDKIIRDYLEKLANKSSSSNNDNTAVNSEWTYSITDNVEMCSSQDGVLIAQKKTDSYDRTKYYPVCYSGGKTDVDAVFNTSNVATLVFYPQNTTVSLYASTGTTGAVIGKSSGSGQDSFTNAQFKSINVVLPPGKVTPAEGYILGNITSYLNSSGSNLTANSNYATSILNNILLHELAEKSKAELKLNVKYNQTPEWPSYTSEEHKKADEMQCEEEEDQFIKEEVQNKLCNNLGRTTCNQTYYDDKDEEDECDDSPAINQGREQHSAKKKMKCPTMDMSKYIRKDSIPCWGCNIE